MCRGVVFSTVMLSIYVMAVAAVNDTLKLVNLVYRHGDRAPSHTYPNNPTPNTTWVDGLGRLTKKGEREQYSLGRFLRRRYDGFLSKTYKHTEIRVESSDVERCLMSAYSNLAGLYRPSVDQEFNTNISWQPIPVHTRPENEDNMMAIWKPCPKFDQLYKNNRKTDKVVQIEADNEEFFDYVSEKSGASIDIHSLYDVIDTLFCEKEHNITSPPWVNDTIYHKMLELEAWRFDFKYNSKEGRKFKGGPLLKEWIKLADQKRNDEEYTIKMNMFSAHETTVIAILGALGLHNGLIPTYTSTVIMELHQESPGSYYVELYFRNVSSQDPDDDTPVIPLTLPDCDFQCPYNQFVSLTRDVVPVDWDAECSLDVHVEDQNDSTDFRRGYRSSAVRVYDQKTLVSGVVNAKIMKTEGVATTSTECKLNEVACKVSRPCADFSNASVTSSKLDRGNVSFTFNFN